MTSARVGSESVEAVVTGATAAARVGSEAVETIVVGATAATRVGGEAVEAVIVGVPCPVRFGGIAVEVLVPLGTNPPSDSNNQIYMTVLGQSSQDMLTGQIYYAISPSLVLPSGDSASQIYVNVKAPSSPNLAVQVYENVVASLSSDPTATLVVYRR